MLFESVRVDGEPATVIGVLPASFRFPRAPADVLLPLQHARRFRVARQTLDRAMYDVIVVGARCAGAPTAMLLARRGYRVLIVDNAQLRWFTRTGVRGVATDGGLGVESAHFSCQWTSASAETQGAPVLR